MTNKSLVTAATFFLVSSIAAASVNEGTGSSSVNEGTGGSSVNEGTGGSSVNEGTGGSSVNEGTGGSSVNEGTGGSSMDFFNALMCKYFRLGCGERIAVQPSWIEPDRSGDK